MQVGIHPVLPSPPSDVFVLGLPYVRCLFFQRSSSRCVGFASGVPTAFAFELSKTVAFPRLLCTSEVPPNGPNPREVSLPWLSPVPLLVPTRPTRGVYPLCSFPFCVCGGVSSSSVRRAQLGWARCHVVPLALQHLLTATYGVVLWWSTLLVVGGGTDVSLSRRLASTQCFRRRLATPSCSACRTFAVYSCSAVLRAVLVSRVAFRRRSLSTSRRQWRFSVRFVPQRCRPTGPTHGRLVSLS